MEKSRTDWSVDWCDQTPFELSWFQLFSRHVEISTKLENDWLMLFNKQQLVKQNRAKLYFWSTTFNMLNSIFQCSHYTLFNICWTEAATFVAQQMLNCEHIFRLASCRNSHPHIPCFSLGTPGTMKWTFEFRESTRKLKMMNRTHTDERKMVQLWYLVPGCVISKFSFVLLP